MKVLASPLVPNSPDTPKSQSLTCPLRQRRTLEGLMSDIVSEIRPIPLAERLTSVYDLSAVQVRQAVQHTFSDLAQDLLARSSTQFLDLAVNAVQAASFAELHRY